MGDKRNACQPEEREERTGTYGGDDGALEHERTEVQPGEETGIEATPVGKEEGDVHAHPDRRR